MPTHPTPAEVFDRAVRQLLAKDMNAFTDLYAEDAVMEFPFAPPGRPGRLDGREAVRAYLADYPDHLDVHRVHDVELHETTDPAVLVAEFVASGTVVATGADYSARYIAVLTIADGLIRHYRDYWNPLALAEVPVGRGTTA
ncbi:nuclear transport factor 2 family protein [Plantactinospora sp. WMMB334]|uniref:nuclear transport factor 2 family protein n=1 Tax=Plantactinospora sp. WMMB334 TaxID=3404119 RepID=UPI003B94FD27